MKLEIEKDLKIRYDDQLEYYVRQWLTACMEKYSILHELIESKKELHNLSLDNELFAQFNLGFNEAKSVINKAIQVATKKQPVVVKELINDSLHEYWVDLERAWLKLKNEYVHGKSKEVRFPLRFARLEGILEFPQVFSDGIDATIERIKDELYVSFASEVDYDFVEQVSRLAEHYNEVLGRLREHDKIHSFPLLFTINSNNQVEPRTEGLANYQSIFGELINNQQKEG